MQTGFGSIAAAGSQPGEAPEYLASPDQRTGRLQEQALPAEGMPASEEEPAAQPEPQPSVSDLFAAAGITQFSPLQPLQGAEGGLAAVDGPAPVDLSQFEQVVQSILVSAPGSADQQVRITLAGTRFEGTEVLITRQEGGILSVTFAAQGEAAYQAISAASEGLREALARQERDGVRIEVRQQGGTDREDGDSRRRSRGYNGWDDENSRE